MRLQLNLFAFLLVALSPFSQSCPQISLRDAATALASVSKYTEGENHTALVAPTGAELRPVSVGNNGDQIATYWSASVSDSDAEHAFIMIHGRLRDGANYFSIMYDALQSALAVSYPSANPKSIVVAPEFFSTVYNSGQYTARELGWGELNAWQAGETATHPVGTKSSSFDVLDSLIDNLANKTAFPKMANITLVGHGGGGQFIQRYAVVGKDVPAGTYLRYIVGDPSTSVYFTADRQKVSGVTTGTCSLFNTWRYGFVNFSGTSEGLKDPSDYFKTYISRDVVNMVGLRDTAPDGDQNCPALLQGGSARRDRNLAYYRYINTLGRTAYDVSKFNGSFGNLPDWSNVTLNKIATRLIVVEGAGHNAEQVFGGDEGRAALFNWQTLPTGWRPPGWSARGNGQALAATAGVSTTASSGSAAFRAESLSVLAALLTVAMAAVLAA